MVVTIEPPISKTLMINAAHVRSLRVLRTREARNAGHDRLAGVHDRHTGLEAGQTKRQLRKEDDGHDQHHPRIRVFDSEKPTPVVKCRGMREQHAEFVAHDDDVDGQVKSDQAYGQPNRFLETLRKMAPEGRQQRQRVPRDDAASPGRTGFR